MSDMESCAPCGQLGGKGWQGSSLARVQHGKHHHKKLIIST